jgi:hypothetical protein
MLVLLGLSACFLVRCENPYVASYGVLVEDGEVVFLGEGDDQATYMYSWQGDILTYGAPEDCCWDFTNPVWAGQSLPEPDFGGREFWGEDLIGVGQDGLVVGTSEGDFGDRTWTFQNWDGAAWVETVTINAFAPTVISRVGAAPQAWEWYFADVGDGGPAVVHDLGTGASRDVQFQWEQPDTVDGILADYAGVLYAWSPQEIGTESCTSGALDLTLLCDVVPMADGVQVWGFDENVLVSMEVDADCGVSEFTAHEDLGFDVLENVSCGNAIVGGSHLGDAARFGVFVELEDRGQAEDPICWD